MSIIGSSEHHRTPSKVLKRPAIKAKTACNRCREKKRRCDERRPCYMCVEEDIDCEYPTSRPTQKNKLLFDSVIQHIQYSTQEVESLYRRLDATVKRLERFEHASSPLNAFRGPPESFHTTGSHNLIRLWPTVKNVLDLAGVDIDEDYVSRAEGIPGRYRPTFYRHVSTVDAVSRRSTKSSIPPSGALNHERNFLDMLPKADLFLAYVQHMHILHPFLDLRLVEESPSLTNCQDVSARLLSSIYRPDAGSASSIRHSTPISISAASERSEKDHVQAKYDATVLLVLAIGAICLEKVDRSSSASPFKRAFPRERSVSVNASAQVPLAHDERSPMSLSQQSRPVTAPTPRHEHGEANWHWPVKYQSTACYLEAMRRLDGCDEHEDLVMVHIYLLAALYKGQYGEVYDANTWLNKAGTVCRRLLMDRGLLTGAHDFSVPRSEEDLHAMQSRVREDIDDRILLAAWSTIQLESDILAELHLAPSELRSDEDNIPWPIRLSDIELYNALNNSSSVTSLPSASDIFKAYLAQLWLRKRLNHTQRWLYGNATNTLSIGALCDTLKGPINDLAGWRETLPPAFHWQDADPPATDILQARLRAKYYGASYITHRPFLDYWLHIAPKVRNGEDLTSAAVAADGSNRGNAETKIFRAIDTLTEHETWDAATDCIAAAVQSTCAFDGILSQHRLVVTNIHGTAHAQFGNLLVLCAAYSHHLGRKMMASIDLRQLLLRTISFLSEQNPSFQTCKIDCDILLRLFAALPT